jgi:hypothetical protein
MHVSRGWGGKIAASGIAGDVGTVEFEAQMAGESRPERLSLAVTHR